MVKINNQVLTLSHCCFCDHLASQVLGASVVVVVVVGIGITFPQALAVAKMKFELCPSPSKCKNLSYLACTKNPCWPSNGF